MQRLRPDASPPVINAGLEAALHYSYAGAPEKLPGGRGISLAAVQIQTKASLPGVTAGWFIFNNVGGGGDDSAGCSRF